MWFISLFFLVSSLTPVVIFWKIYTRLPHLPCQLLVWPLPASPVSLLLARLSTSWFWSSPQSKGVSAPVPTLPLHADSLPGLPRIPVWEKYRGLHCCLWGLIRMIPGNAGYGTEPWWKSFLGQSHSWFTKLVLDYSCCDQFWQVTRWGLESPWVWSLVTPLRDDLD